MYENIKADLARLSSSGKPSLRTLIAGLLSQGFQAILVYRFFNWLQRKGLPGQPLRFLLERFIEITCGISIPACCKIGKGFRIHHFGGIIFHPTTKLGENCTFYHGVTIGDSGGSGNAATIGNNVLIGAGAKIIGELTIGDNVTIGANTVVTKDVSPNTVVVGSPARFLSKKDIPEIVEAEDSIQPDPVRVMDFRGTYKGGGGPDKTVLNSAALHDPEKVDVLVTYIKQPDDDEFQIPQMAAERNLKYVDLIDHGRFDLKCLFGLRKLIKQNRIQVLHTHDDKTLLYGVALRLIVPGLRLLHTCHSHSVYERKTFSSTVSWYKFQLRKKIQLFLMKCHHKPILTVSGNTRQRLIDGGLRPDTVQVLHNGIDVDKWSRSGALKILRKELGLNDEQLLVGTVARITYDKDLPTFFAVAQKVVAEIPEAVFVIVGDGYGDELGRAKVDVEKMGLSDVVKFTGHRNDLKNIYASFDIFLMTSLTEGMPNTVLEAMALELPIVSTNVGGLPELVEDEISGLLAPVGEVTLLSEAVSKLLNDEKLRKQFAKAARKRIEQHFDFANRVKCMEDLYLRFAGKGGNLFHAKLAENAKNGER